MKYLVMALMFMGVSACVQPPQRVDAPWMAEMRRYVGRPIDEVVFHKGLPVHLYEIENGMREFQYQRKEKVSRPVIEDDAKLSKTIKNSRFKYRNTAGMIQSDVVAYNQAYIDAITLPTPKKRSQSFSSPSMGNSTYSGNDKPIVETISLGEFSEAERQRQQRLAEKIQRLNALPSADDPSQMLTHICQVVFVVSPADIVTSWHTDCEN